MRSLYFTLIFASIFVAMPDQKLFAADFDQDGYDDFIFIEINSQSRLQWNAIDLNDPARRSVGSFGGVNDHLAVGDWLGLKQSSMARVRRKTSGDFEWSVALPGDDKLITFGKDPDKVFSGMDVDNSGIIDPVVVSKVGKSLHWNILMNPGVTASPLTAGAIFGTKKEFPFFANLDGTGDNLATARVSKQDRLIIRSLSMVTGIAKTTRIKKYKGKISKILPIALPAGGDGLFVISKKGKKFTVTLVHGKRKHKTFIIRGDEFVVGKYLGDGRELLVIRNNATAGTFVDSSGVRIVLPVDLAGTLYDDININTFKKDKSPKSPPGDTPDPPSGGGGRGSNPACSGTQISTDHLLYKPVSDTSGNVVLVFDSTYGREFQSVKLELNDGTYTECWWRPLELWGNPDAGGMRQHWRTNVRSHQVRDGATIIATDANQECRFAIPGSAGRRWE